MVLTLKRTPRGVLKGLLKDTDFIFPFICHFICHFSPPDHLTSEKICAFNL